MGLQIEVRLLRRNGLSRAESGRVVPARATARITVNTRGRDMLPSWLDDSASSSQRPAEIGDEPCPASPISPIAG